VYKLLPPSSAVGSPLQKVKAVGTTNKRWLHTKYIYVIKSARIPHPNFTKKNTMGEMFTKFIHKYLNACFRRKVLMAKIS